MCFVLYIGTDQPLANKPWDENNRHLNTANLGEHDGLVAPNFSKPHTKYLGSDQGCGCGFRHLSFQNGEWPEEWNIDQNLDYDGADEEKIHQELYDFIAPLLSSNQTVELYGCWDGDFEESIEYREEIVSDCLLDRKFFFRERGFYTVTQH